MLTFFIALLTLVVGFLTYSVVVERLLPPDDRETPAIAHPDGVDYLPLPIWKSFLIQLLNIAGLGPIFGALSGALWGPVVYFWIVFGTIFAGGVHDYFSGMLSERHNGASISEIVGIYLGPQMKTVMRIFAVVLLVLVGTTFSTGPAGLLALLTPKSLNVTFWLAIILVYYFLATLLPIDKIIGRFYPFFGAALIVMCVGVGGGLVVQGYELPEMWNSFANLHPRALPIWPLMFITVACGAISGFHATQSPMMARCITSEYQGRKVFYGAMVAEGVIALIWAAAGVSVYNGTQGLWDATTSLAGQSALVYDICIRVLGPVGGVLAMIGVIVCPITSGDTAFRSARLTLADWFGIDQKPRTKRLLLSVPLLLCGALLSNMNFQVIWRYFSWSNQTLAMIALWAAAVFLCKVHHNFWPLAIPATFMSAVSSTYILVAPEGFGPMISKMVSGEALTGAAAIDAAAKVGYPVGIAFAALCFAIFWFKCVRTNAAE
ncbi:carbon starvation CstA family protein [Cloacibacillus porcorum]|uniref:carbon starvation CstA family protein n=1 Tax=Cloacibacillus porcorum TaxID=1197717 RepID=UPI0023F28FB7|nr:carbon starvation CstA family protein [Cloacibacillus porcorum]MDD7649284.1 carbon starvation CstA family protein [Cloacibacillus porcorum]MDY4093494.1 carbon starvation CstA family protein [Cloacibacillus porcorum]